MRRPKRQYTIYWYNPTVARTGYVNYITYSRERAVYLFNQNFSKEYEIVIVSN